MKYIVFIFQGNEIPVMFPGIITHYDFAQNFPFPVVSAGFVRVEDDGSLTAYGESVSLEKKSRERDSVLLEWAKKKY
jgi:hypothetical protein